MHIGAVPRGEETRPPVDHPGGFDSLEPGLRGKVEDAPGDDHPAFATKGITTIIFGRK